jgi:ABC-type transport system involved in multi-copper enzyme maturation permease subunit
MQAFLVLLRYDLSQMGRSWIVRIWVALLFIPAVFVLGVAANENELASESLAAYIAAVMAPLSWLAVSIYAASAVSGEAGVATDAILSKSVTRTEYISAKVAARMGVTVFVYLLIMLPFTYLLRHYAVPDTTTLGVATGLFMVGALLAFLAALGILLSTVFRNVQIAVLCALMSVLLSGLALQFLELNWLSTTAVINELPDTFRGDTSTLTAIRVVIVFGALTVAAISSSLWLFRQKDL